MYPDKPRSSKKRRAQRQIGLGAIVVTVALCFGTVAVVSIVRLRKNDPAESLPLSSDVTTSAAGGEDATDATMAVMSASTSASTAGTAAKTTVPSKTTASTVPTTTARRTYAETPTTTGPTSAKVKAAGKCVLGDVPILWQQPDFPAGCESTAAVIAMRYAGESDLSVATFVDEYLEQGVVDNGIPCIVWVTIGMVDAYYSSSWTLEDGSPYRWLANEHCMVLIGYDDTYFYFSDPYRGKQLKFQKWLCRSRHEIFGKQSLVIAAP